MEITALRRFPSTLYLGTVGSVFVTVYFNPPTLEMYDEYERLQLEFAERRGGRCSSLSIIQQVTLAPESAIRERTKQLTVKFAPHLQAVAIVITAAGLGAVFARAFLAALALVAQEQAPQKTFRFLKDGVAWLGTQDPGVPAGDELVQALERFVAS